MKNWKYKRLSECSNFISERTSNITIDNYISTENMIENRGGVKIASTLPDVKSTSAYKPNDILLSNIRPYFCKIWFADKKGSCSNDVLVVRAKKEIDPKFLYYVLSDQNFFNWDSITSKGTKMPRGTPNAIMKYSVPDIPLPTQQKIASILSAYDNLIQNYKKQIEALQTAASELYKEWFVRFRFPGYQTTNFENGIPEGWKVYLIKDLCYINKKTVSSKDAKKEILYLDTGSITENVIDSFESYILEEAPSRARRIVKKNSIIFSTVRPNQNHYGILKTVPENLIVSTGFAVFDPKFDIANILYFFLSSKDFVDYCQMIAEGAVATYPSIKPEEIGKVKILLPTMDLAIKLNHSFESLFLRIENLKQQITNLTQQRDLLLPRLMSGKLEVE